MSNFYHIFFIIMYVICIYTLVAPSQGLGSRSGWIRLSFSDPDPYFEKGRIRIRPGYPEYGGFWFSLIRIRFFTRVGSIRLAGIPDDRIQIRVYFSRKLVPDKVYPEPQAEFTYSPQISSYTEEPGS